MSDLDRQLLELAGSKSPVRRNQLLIHDDTDRERRPEKLRKLVRAGADINTRDGFDGATVVHILAQMGDLEALDAAVELGADVTAVDDAGHTALHVIAESKNVEVLEHILSLGVEVDARSESEETALHDWAYWGSPGGVRLLLDRGADPDLQRDDGNTPLHLAAIAGLADNVRTLLEGGATPGIKNDQGQTALDLARQHDRWDVAKILSDVAGDEAPVDSDDPTAQLQALARKLGKESAESAVNSGDWDYYVDEELDPTDLAYDYWDANFVFIVERAYDDLAETHDLPPRRELLKELFNTYYDAFGAAAPDWE